MRTIFFLLQKEFLQIFRNKAMLPMIFVVPIVQLLVLTYAVSYEMKQIRVQVVDQDMSSTSKRFISKLDGSSFYTVNGYSTSTKEAENALVRNDADLLVVIPANFEKNLVKENKSGIQLIINAINANVAGLTNAYTYSVLVDFNKEVIQDIFSISTRNNLSAININYSYWYNQEMDYKIFMAPGILVMLVTTIGLFLSGMNIVREKEIGTIEQLNVTPIKKYQFVIGKLSPFLIIALAELAIGIVISKLLFHIPINGSLLLVFAFATIYLIVLLSMGLIVSTITKTQQQAMLFTWFFLVVFILMSGLFTSIESMPRWAQIVDYFNPLTYFIRVIRLVMLKGSGFEAVKDQFIIMGSYAIAILSIAVLRYRKTV
ncbi:MAG: ABC transporter permease [Bacteroidota bacterium]